MEPLSLTLRGAHSETTTKGCPLVVPWLGLVQNVSPCAAWDLQQQIQNQIPLGSGTLGTQRRHRWTLYQAYSLRHLSPWGEPRASLLAGKHGAGEEGNARPSCTRGGAGMPMGTALAGNREQGHTRAWTQRHDSPRPRGTARSRVSSPLSGLHGVGRFPATNTQAGPLPRPLPTRPGHVCSAVAAGCYNISPKHLNSSSLV